MIRKILPLFLSILFISIAFPMSAQKDVDLVNSGQVLYDGNLYYRMGRYSKAEEEYRKVGRNDTNYARVLRDLALAYSDDKEDSLCVVTSRAGLELNSVYAPDFYNLLGLSYNEMRKFDSAIAVFDRALALYPYTFVLAYQKGMTYYKMKKYNEAMLCFQNVVKINPYHAASHFQLGKICAEQGRMIPALLSYEFYLMLDPSSERSQKVVSQLEDLTTGDYQPDPDFKLSMTEAGDDCFSDLNDIISSGRAYNAAYKNKTKISLKLVKQMQMFFEQMKYKENSGNWWMEYYVPFFMEMQKNEYFVPYISYSLASVGGNNPTVAKSVRKNKKKIGVFAKWAGTYINDHLDHPAKDLLGLKVGEAEYIFYDNHSIAGVGKKDPKENPVGDWIYFHERSGHIFAKGTYNDAGKKEGEWITYWDNGKVKNKTHYVNGIKVGESTEYHDNGVISFTCNYLAGEIEGVYELYSVHGGISERATMSAGHLNGDATTFYSNGSPRLEMHYKMDKMDGFYRAYSLNGKLVQDFNYVNGKQSGNAKEFFGNGALKSEGQYKNDQPIGYWKIYFENGKIRREGSYTETGREGVWKEYYRNGNLSAEGVYKGGKYNGSIKEYDTDGILYENRIYASDRIKQMTFYNKSGTVIADYVLNKETEVTEYYPSGIRSGFGTYLNGEREGDWKIYSDNGGWLMSKEHYHRGYLSGERTEYYANGKEMSEVEYNYGERDGYMKTFYPSGTIESEGWYVRDNREGDWYGYNERGLVTSHKYFIKGDEHGYQIFYDQYGRKDEEDFVKEGYIWSRTRFDSSGVMIYKYESDNGTGTYSFIHPNGKVWVEQNYKNGFREGATRKYAFDGAVVLETNYINGSQYGLRKENYRDSRKPYVETNYSFDDRYGVSTGMWENGNKRWEENYVGGELDGAQNYYAENGTLMKTGTWDMGNVEGELKYFSDDGSLQYVRYYHNGNLLGYSYLDKEGKMLPMIKLEDASGVFTAFYQNGDTSITGKYSNGRLDGRVIEYWPNGKIAEDENYASGDYAGVQRYYYHDGTLRKELNYYSDQQDGIQKYYFENGKLEHTEFFVLGDYYGVWHYYDQSGIEMLIKTWYDDRQLSETVAAPPAPPAVPNKPKSKGK